MANKLTSFWRPIAHKGWWSALLAALVICLSLLYWHKGAATTGFWDDAWEISDPVAGIMTFVTTLVIFYLQARQSWIASLEKQLDVDYIYDGKVIGKIRGAYLSGESDIRAWSQSLGGQLYRGQRLSLDMVMDEVSLPIRKEGDRWINPFKATLYLTSPPTPKKVTNKCKCTDPDEKANQEGGNDETKSISLPMSQMTIGHTRIWTRK